MSIATRIENMSNNIKNAYDSLDDLGLDLDGVDKNLENLSSQIDLIYNELPQIEDSGTEITLEPTKSAKMVLKLNGNSYQKQYTGKNLWGGINFTNSYNGIDFELKKDGTLSANGTASGKSYSYGGTLVADNNIYVELPAGTYTYFVDNPDTDKIEYQLYSFESGATSLNIISSLSNRNFYIRKLYKNRY